MKNHSSTIVQRLEFIQSKQVAYARLTFVSSSLDTKSQTRLHLDPDHINWTHADKRIEITVT
jgi:hypothetical protein